ncbi:carboxymuconolactone decarboxylase family protein [Gorillibacterium sp. sgz500922]|uniref:carboxymuconolactone decarboxylase family protein n=1 Tax=Gorillibacterium sp. sgz500922 TaxID=3446694 RepID=UPI003F681F4F
MSDLLKMANPAVGQAFDDLCEAINGNGVLEPKVKELVRLACVVMDRSSNGVRLHTMKALQEGANREEIIETVLNCLPVAGIESVVSGYAAALSTLETAEVVHHAR